MTCLKNPATETLNCFVKNFSSVAQKYKYVTSVLSLQFYISISFVLGLTNVSISYCISILPQHSVFFKELTAISKQI